MLRNCDSRRRQSALGLVPRGRFTYPIHRTLAGFSSANTNATFVYRSRKTKAYFSRRHPACSRFLWAYPWCRKTWLFRGGYQAPAASSKVRTGFLPLDVLFPYADGRPSQFAAKYDGDHFQYPLRARDGR